MYDIKNLKIWKESKADNPLLNKHKLFVIDALYWEVLMNSEFERIKDIFEQCGLSVTEGKKGRRFIFKIYMSDQLRNKGIEELDLGVRSSNCLRRAGIVTIGQLCERISSSSDLKSIRCCGSKSVSEIMDKLFYYHLITIPKEKQNEYLADVIRMNFYPEDQTIS